MPDQPYFICIGEERCGTSWLYQMLSQHPQIWLPPFKSIDYFTDQRAIPWLFLLAGQRGKRRRLVRGLREGGRLGWYLRYYGLPRSPRWYAGLFDASADQVGGEICHKYSQMSAPQIARMRALVPHAKLIFLMREPISRAWSGLARALARHKRRLDASWDVAALREALAQTSVVQISRYLDTLECWWQHFPREQIYLAYQDQMRDDPAAFLSALTSWLGIGSLDWSRQPHVGEKVAAGRYQPLPDEIRSYLAEKLYEPTRALHNAVGSSYTQGWVSGIEALQTAKP